MKSWYAHQLKQFPVHLLAWGLRWTSPPLPSASWSLPGDPWNPTWPAPLLRPLPWPFASAQIPPDVFVVWPWHDDFETNSVSLVSLDHLHEPG